MHETAIRSCRCSSARYLAKGLMMPGVDVQLELLDTLEFGEDEVTLCRPSSWLSWKNRSSGARATSEKDGEGGETKTNGPSRPRRPEVSQCLWYREQGQLHDTILWKA
jgi:hypothetical protein